MVQILLVFGHICDIQARCEWGAVRSRSSTNSQRDLYTPLEGGGETCLELSPLFASDLISGVFLPNNQLPLLKLRLRPLSNCLALFFDFRVGRSGGTTPCGSCFCHNRWSSAINSGNDKSASGFLNFELAGMGSRMNSGRVRSSAGFLIRGLVVSSASCECKRPASAWERRCSTNFSRYHQEKLVGMIIHGVIGVYSPLPRLSAVPAPSSSASRQTQRRLGRSSSLH